MNGSVLGVVIHSYRRNSKSIQIKDPAEVLNLITGHIDSEGHLKIHFIRLMSVRIGLGHDLQITGDRIRWHLPQRFIPPDVLNWPQDLVESLPIEGITHDVAFSSRIHLSATSPSIVSMTDQCTAIFIGIPT